MHVGRLPTNIPRCSMTNNVRMHGRRAVFRVVILARFDDPYVLNGQQTCSSDQHACCESRPPKDQHVGRASNHGVTGIMHWPFQLHAV